MPDAGNESANGLKAESSIRRCRRFEAQDTGWAKGSESQPETVIRFPALEGLIRIINPVPERSVDTEVQPGKRFGIETQPGIRAPKIDAVVAAGLVARGQTRPDGLRIGVETSKGEIKTVSIVPYLSDDGSKLRFVVNQSRPRHAGAGIASVEAQPGKKLIFGVTEVDVLSLEVDPGYAKVGSFVHGDHQSLVDIDLELVEPRGVQGQDFPEALLILRREIEQVLDLVFARLDRGLGRENGRFATGDLISRVFIASAHAYILVFTEKGRMFWIKVYDIPEADSAGRGRPINRLIGIGPEEKVCSVINVKEFSADKYVVLFSKYGFVKKTALAAFSRPRINGIIAAEVPEGDVLLEAQITAGNNEIILGTYLGKALKFNERDVRAMGRGARGVTAIKLAKDDFVVGADVIGEKGKHILTVTENGFGKKSDLSLYRLQKRGGKGLINIKITEKLGKVIGLVTLHEDDCEIILSSEKGILNKQDASQIRSKGRATQGVKLINLKPGDRLVAIEKVTKEAD